MSINWQETIDWQEKRFKWYRDEIDRLRGIIEANRIYIKELKKESDLSKMIKLNREKNT